MANREGHQVSARAGGGYAWRQITEDEGLLLRAVAMGMILAHNYLHWLADLPGENEFTFRAESVLSLWHGLWVLIGFEFIFNFRSLASTACRV